MYTVVIVDDEPWALQGLAEIIDWNNEGFSIIGQFTDPDEAFEFLCKKEPDVRTFECLDFPDWISLRCLA